MTVKNIFLGLVMLLFAFYPAGAEDTDWVKWRGPHGNSTYDSKAWSPAALQAEPKINWQINVGNGYSGLAVTSDVFYTMGNSGKQDSVYCMKTATGEKVWEYSYDCKPGEYKGPRATPVLENGMLYTLSREGHLFCLKAADGKLLWQKHLVKDFGAVPPQWSFAGTPQIEGELLLINANQYGLAVNKKDGKLIWNSPKGVGGYSSAVVYTQNSKKAVSFFGQKAVYGVDLLTGKKLWEYPWSTSYDVNAADPLIVGNTVFVSSNYNRGCALIDFSDNAQPRKLWENKTLASHFSSFVYAGGYIYGSSGGAGSGSAPLRCVELKTGEVAWEKKLGTGSLIASNGYLLYFTERGRLHIAPINTTGYQEAASAPLLPGICWTAPVMYINMLFLRNDRGDIVCLDLRESRK